MTALAVCHLRVDRLALPVVRDVSLTAKPGRISVLLGANGAGKTTLLEAISGIIPCAGGTIHVAGQPVGTLRPGARFAAGLAHVEQGRTVFKQLTTEDNLRASVRGGATLDEAYALFPELLARRQVRAGLLSGGEQQMVVIARALLGRPKVVMIDEMSAGLAPIVVNRLMAAVRSLADDGLAVVLVEQFANLALAIGDQATVMRRGAVVYEGGCAALLKDPERLHGLYLGAADAA